MTSITPRSDVVSIYQGNDAARLAELKGVAEAAAKKKGGAPRLLGEIDAATDAARAHDEFAAAMEDRAVKVHLHALPRRKWRELMKDHAPRPDSDDDKMLSVNMDTLPDVLLPLSIDAAASGIEGSVEDFLESLSDYDYYDRLFIKAFSLNRGGMAADPKARLSSALTPTSGATSN